VAALFRDFSLPGQKNVDLLPIGFPFGEIKLVFLLTIPNFARLPILVGFYFVRFLIAILFWRFSAPPAPRKAGLVQRALP